MPHQPTHSLRGPRFTAAQRQVLDAIGAALKSQRVDFATAAELSDKVKAGQLDDVRARLEAAHEAP